MFVKIANTPERALELVSTPHFDVMLIDMHMPGMNGIDLAKQILRIAPDAVMLIYTGFEVSNHFNLIMEAGLAGFVSKTSGKERLVTAVRCAARRGRSAADTREATPPRYRKWPGTNSRRAGASL